MAIDPNERLRRYVDATVDGVIGDLASTGGGRNEALRDASIRVGVFVAQGLLDEDEAARRLFDAADANGYTRKDGDRETKSVIRRGLRFGAEEGTVPDELENILRDVAAHRANGHGAVLPRREPDRMPPPHDEVLSLWAACTSVTDDEATSGYLRARGVDPDRVADEGLARVLPEGDLPRWAYGWPSSGHRLVIPLFDARGAIRSMLARDVTQRAERKSLAPTGYSRRELVMACGRGRQLLRSGREACRIVVCEGEIDMLVVSTQRSEADESAAIGIFSGSWSPAIVARIADGSELVLATDDDEAGEKYAAAITASVEKRRINVSRWKSTAGDVAKAGGLAGGQVIQLHRPGAPIDVRAVLAEWRTEGALVHEPTGFETLDRITRGGFVYGTTTVLQGAPNACKTVFSIHLAHEFVRRDIVVGIQAADESASDLVTRLAQRIGFERDDVEKREPGAIDVLERHLGSLPLFFFDDETTIERAVEDLVRLAAGRRCMFVVDSLQVVRCAAETERDLPEQRQIAARTVALRRLAKKHRMIVLVTSETSRASYRGGSEDRIEDIAAGKGSGSIEFKAKVLLTMRKVKRAPGVYSVSPTKNKLQRDDSDEPFFLRLDRDRQVLEETEKPTEQGDAEKAEKAEQAKQAEAEQDARVERMAEQILVALLKANTKGAKITSRTDLYPLIKGAQNLKGRAVSLLISSGRIRKGKGGAFGPPTAEPAAPSPNEGTTPPPEASV